MMNRTRTSVGARVSDAADEAFEATTHALDSSRKFATEAADRIAERARELRDSARDLRDSAADLARMGAESVTDATIATQRRLGRYTRATSRYVAKQPLKSTLIAAAVGAVAAALVLTVMRSRRERE